jgi:hypothetical protein
VSLSIASSTGATAVRRVHGSAYERWPTIHDRGLEKLATRTAPDGRREARDNVYRDQRVKHAVGDDGAVRNFLNRVAALGV